VPPNESTAALLGLRSPSALAAREARFSRVCRTRHLPAPGFPTLLPVCFFPNLPALFHAGNALGVFPSGPFPLAEPSVPSGHGTFLVLTVAHVRSRLPGNPPDRLSRLQGLALCEDSTPARRCEPPRGPLPSWVSMVSRDFPPEPVRRFRGGSPLGLCTRPGSQSFRPFAVTHAAPQGLDRPGIGWSLARLPPLLTFCTSSLNRRFEPAALPGLWFRPSVQPLLPEAGGASSAGPRSLPELCGLWGWCAPGCACGRALV
jgi:hypothetical protein